MEGHALELTYAHALPNGQEISAKKVETIQVKIPMSPTTPLHLGCYFRGYLEQRNLDRAKAIVLYEFKLNKPLNKEI